MEFDVNEDRSSSRKAITGVANGYGMLRESQGAPSHGAWVGVDQFPGAATGERKSLKVREREHRDLACFNEIKGALPLPSPPRLLLEECGRRQLRCDVLL